MSVQVMIFLSFLVLSGGLHIAKHCAEKRKAARQAAGIPEPKLHVGKHMSLASIGSMCLHPTFLEGTKEFITHIVVYSGMVIPKH